MNNDKKIIVVLGPTASGKSDFAVNLALKNNGEIISADSRQIYKYLDLGTGKITKEEMRGVKHYMLDISDIKKDYSVAKYKEIAQKYLLDIFARNKTPIICGGTGQYIDSLIFDITFPKVKANKKLRTKLQKLTKEKLFEILKEKDKRRAKTIDKDNKVRLIRALEIIEGNGVVPLQNKPKLKYKTEIYLMNPNREILRQRIKDRLEKRLRSGMLEEVKDLIKKEHNLKDIAKRGIEYRFIEKYLNKDISYEEMKEKLFFAIWHYAKRQMTWNKKYQNKYSKYLTKIETLA